jgi:hypothetical protein
LIKKNVKKKFFFHHSLFYYRIKLIKNKIKYPRIKKNKGLKILFSEKKNLKLYFKKKNIFFKKLKFIQSIDNSNHQIIYLIENDYNKYISIS